MNPPSTIRNRLTHRGACLLACATFPLIWWGGLVTTTGAGMAFRDWLTSDGYFMPFFPWLSSTGDKFIEHGHRLLGMTVGLLAIGLVILAFKTDTTPGARKLSLVILAGVLVQGVLGGLRVVLDARTLALLHGCTGPLFFALCVAMVVVTSAWWQQAPPVEPNRLSKKYYRLAQFTVLLAYSQLIAGALVRHSPHLLGHQAGNIFHAAVYFHLMLALALLAHVVLLAARSGHIPDQRRFSFLLLALLVVQVCLGSATWVVKYGLPTWAAHFLGELPFANTADDLPQALLVTTHVAVGSLILVTTVTIAMRTGRQLRVGLPAIAASMLSSVGVAA